LKGLVNYSITLVQNEEELRKHREDLEEMVAIATSEVKAIVQTAVNSVITIDESGIIRHFNPAAEELFGWQSEEIVGKNVSLLMPEPNASSHDGFLKRFIETNEANIIGRGREVAAMRKDGSVFPAHLAVGHSRLKHGRHLFVGFITRVRGELIHSVCKYLKSLNMILLI
jgi:PAS domain S-box-containing protein